MSKRKRKVSKKKATTKSQSDQASEKKKAAQDPERPADDDGGPIGIAGKAAKAVMEANAAAPGVVQDTAGDMVSVRRQDVVLLEQIRELGAEVSELRKTYDAAKEVASEHRKVFDEARTRLEHLCNATEQETPLLDYAATNAWRDVPLAEVIGEKHTEKLWGKISGVMASQHLGPFSDFIRTHPLTDIGGIGERTADAIMDAMFEWWRAHRHWAPPEHIGAGPDVEAQNGAVQDTGKGDQEGDQEKPSGPQLTLVEESGEVEAY